jgi:hypothetical protein
MKDIRYPGGRSLPADVQGSAHSTHWIYPDEGICCCPSRAPIAWTHRERRTLGAPSTPSPTRFSPPLTSPWTCFPPLAPSRVALRPSRRSPFPFLVALPCPLLVTCAVPVTISDTSRLRGTIYPAQIQNCTETRANPSALQCTIDPTSPFCTLHSAASPPFHHPF